jgi:hypothetical protein
MKLNSMVRIALTADRIIVNGESFDKFAYSLRSGAQNFSITDEKNGHLLATIVARPLDAYDITVKTNKFAFWKNIGTSALGIGDSFLTSEIIMTTQGKIAFDIRNNLQGTADLSFDGGNVQGLGFDNFYANAATITILNAEQRIASALEAGSSELKSARVIGEYKDNKFQTTAPFSISMRHVNGQGNLQMENGKLSANMNLIMRGSSPAPTPISLNILPSGVRSFSLSQIMPGFDPEYLRQFVSAHNKF